MTLIIGLVVVGLLLVVGLAVLAHRAAQKRREAFAALAVSKGWTYAVDDDRWVQAFDGAPFGLGHGRSAGNVLTGSSGNRPFVAFDYSYRTTETSTDAQGHTSTHEETHTFSVCALQVSCTFPDLHVRPENFLSRAVGHLTNRDIELESEAFNRAFTVTCSDRKFASDVLHPRQMEMLLAHTHLDWRFDRDWVLSVSTRTLRPEEVEPSLGVVGALVDNIPDFVWQDHAGPAAHG
ncbi:DUF3137 domain-containing protein [Nocardioides terrisoli]|uniref:DUF3137 domain-containing protein n=1 Tax=Nocardioides terrisoli TaxID=3388267 RepID=UPI00287B96EB|nr:DUF3137 domain-containing protein [Nocardioides marmorisolisilvae]